MTPYAYSIADYDERYIFPTLDAAVAYMKKNHYEAAYQFEHNPVTAHYPDGTDAPTSLHDYINVVKVDEDEVAAYVDGLCDDARKYDAENDAKARAEGRHIHLRTGNPPALYAGS